MNHQKNSVIDMTFLMSSLFCCLYVYQLFKARFLSVLFIIPLIGFGSTYTNIYSVEIENRLGMILREIFLYLA